LTFNVNRSDEFARALSITVIAIPKSPAAVGIPLIWPLVALRVKPAGSPVAVQRYGGWPPEAASSSWNGRFNVAAGNCRFDVMAREGGLIARPNERDAVSPTESATCKLKANVPAVVGVPLIVSVEG